MEEGIRKAEMPRAHKSHNLSLIILICGKVKPLPGSSTWFRSVLCDM